MADLCASPTGVLTVSGVALHGPCWTILDLTPLWVQADVRGDDRLLPGVTGVIPYRRRTTVTRHSLPMWVIGEVSWTDAAYADPWVGLETNLNYLYTNVVAPTGAGDGTRPGSLAMPSGATRTADVHILSLELGGTAAGTASHAGGAAGAGVRATLELSIPDGRFS
jgi:hypothetical protein